MRTLFFVLLLALNQAAYAQNSPKTGSFNVINLKHSFSDSWSAYIENQWRSLDFFDRFYYYELKSGVTYSLNKTYDFTLGTGVYNTFNEGPEFENYHKQFEYRIWEQFNIEHKLSVINFEHRYRIEQRFKETYANRFRYRLKADIPLNSATIRENTLFASLYNELFFTDEMPNFSRNRFMAGGGFRFQNNITIHGGYLRQVDFSKNNTRRKNYFFSSIAVDF